MAPILSSWLLAPTTSLGTAAKTPEASKQVQTPLPSPAS
jgi:hypothetical protein